MDNKKTEKTLINLIKSTFLCLFFSCRCETQAEFLLGMTATHERADGFNIFELFDYNIAYEIRLQEALEADMLAPFHYFGVTDYEKDGELISDTTTINQLVEEERVNYLIHSSFAVEYPGLTLAVIETSYK